MPDFIRPDTDELLEAMYARERVTAAQVSRGAALFVAKLVLWIAACLGAVSLIFALSVGLMSRIETELAITPEQAIAMMEAR